MRKLKAKGRGMEAAAKRQEFLSGARDAPQMKPSPKAPATTGKSYFTYYLPSDLGQRVRYAAVGLRKHPAGVVEDALLEYLDKLGVN